MMKLVIDEDVARQRISQAMDDLAALNIQFFDPAVGLPPLPPRSESLPPWSDLYSCVPDTHMHEMEFAFVQMMTFAGHHWPPVLKVLDAEPLFEWAMHSDVFDPDYRDHIVHQMRVAAIGDMLLKATVNGQTLLDRVTETLAKKLEEAEVEDREGFVRMAWWLTALLHDCGYPCQHHQKRFRKLVESYCVALAGACDANWFASHKAVAELVPGLTHRDLGNSEEARHAFIGAAELAGEALEYEKLIDGCAVEDPAIRDRRRLLFSLVVEAILRHHFPAGARDDFCPDERLQFGEAPLGYLLIVSDELHEFSRVCTRLRRNSKQTVIEYEKSPVTGVTVTCTGRTLGLQYELVPGTTAIKGKPVHKWLGHKKSKLDESLLFAPGESLERLQVSTA